MPGFHIQNQAFFDTLQTNLDEETIITNELTHTVDQPIRYRL